MTRPFAARTERDVLHVVGPDAVSFLQGQLSQDVAALAIGDSAWTLLLQPNGKLVAWLRATRVGDGEVVLDGDPGSGEVVKARLERFKLRTRADVDLERDVACVAVRGRPPEPARRGLAITWPGVDGYDLLGPSAEPPEDVPLVDLATYERARIEAGVPRYGCELTEDTIPGEGGQWFIDTSVSFTKGCYTGQELVARIDSRGGNVPRPIRRLALDAVVGVGAPVDAGGVSVGVVTSAAATEDGRAVALAPLKRSVEPGAAVRVDGVAGTVR